MTVQIALRAASPAAPRAADRPRAPSLIVQLAALWWWGVRQHVAALHGFPRDPEDEPPLVRWPFSHL